MLKVYAARAMSGRQKRLVRKEAKSDAGFLRDAGISVLCPVEEEKVDDSPSIISSSYGEMARYWKRDKQMIREAHIIFDMTPHLNSEGSKHEIGYGRYFLWKPVVRIFPLGKLPSLASVAYFEDDYICDSLLEAIEYSYRVHGNWLKRLWWRLKMLNRCLPRFLTYQLGAFK